MFVLAEMQDIIRIEPRRFGRDTGQEISDELNKKFANKVVHNVGVCIALFDVTRIGESYIFPGDGASHTKVHFRFVVFRPFIDEIVVGKIRSCSFDGVRGFFDDVLIPHQSLQHPKRFDQGEQLWVWEYESEDGKHDMFMDVDELIRFRVVNEVFVDTLPMSVQPSAAPVEPVPSPGVTDTSGPQQPPYTIIGSVSESGLGLISWWSGS